jgi:hypothetical protein
MTYSISKAGFQEGYSAKLALAGFRNPHDELPSTLREEVKDE